MDKKLLYPVFFCLMAAVLAGCATLLPEPIDENSSILAIKRTLKNTSGTSPGIDIEGLMGIDPNQKAALSGSLLN